MTFEQAAGLVAGAVVGGTCEPLTDYAALGRARDAADRQRLNELLWRADLRAARIVGGVTWVNTGVLIEGLEAHFGARQAVLSLIDALNAEGDEEGYMDTARLWDALDEITRLLTPPVAPARLV